MIFTESCEAPGALNRVAYLQSTEPARRDSYVEVLELTPLGVVALNEIYPMHMLRRVTLAASLVLQVLRSAAAAALGLPLLFLIRASHPCPTPTSS